MKVFCYLMLTEGWLIGWRSLVHLGTKETGEWQWTFQVGDLENVNITHWAVMPKAPGLRNERDKTHGNYLSRDGEKRMKLHSTENVWVAGRCESYDKKTGFTVRGHKHVHRQICSGQHQDNKTGSN